MTYKKINNSKKILFWALIIFACVFAAAKTQAVGNVYGWAWSENIGWISFNKLGTTDHLGNPVPAGGGNFDYGVNIDNISNKLSGYAWSENIGWITFNDSELTGCPISPCNAKFYPGSSQVYGWARACAVFDSNCSGTLNSNRGGWDGWIHLSNLWIDTSVNPAEFHYWVWGASDDSADTGNTKAVTGWGTFNCAEGSANAASVCTSQSTSTPSNYKVVTTFSSIINGACGSAAKQYPAGSTGFGSDTFCSAGTPNPSNPPFPTPSIPTTWTCVGSGTGHTDATCTATLATSKPEVTHVTPPYKPLHEPPGTDELYSKDYCNNTIWFQWRYYSADNSNETRFDFQISENDDPNGSMQVSLSAGLSIPMSNLSGTTNKQPVKVVTNPSSDPTSGQIAFGKIYYWWVKVYDSQQPKPNDSDWVEGVPFKTPAHDYPHPNFDFDPKTPLVNKPVSFDSSTSSCYNACTSYNWDFGDNSPTINAATASHSYSFPGKYTVTLTVGDDVGFCPIPKDVQVNSPLTPPTWKEISPF